MTADTPTAECPATWPGSEDHTHGCHLTIDHRDNHRCTQCGQTIAQCGAEYAPERRDPTARIVRCDRPLGHAGDHEELYTGGTWAATTGGPDHDGLTGRPHAPAAGNRPADPPSSPAEPPAAPGPHPGTPEGRGPILGRALIDRNGELWWQRPGCPSCPPGSVQWWNGDDHEVASEIAHDLGPVTEAVLVTPAGARIIEAARQWVRAWDADPFGPATSVAKARLAAAVDAATGDHPEFMEAAVDAMQTGQPDGTANLAVASRGLAVDAATPGRAGRDHAPGDVRCDGPLPTGTTPGAVEPGDGPGWRREQITGHADWLENLAPDDEREPELAAELLALLADRDRLATGQAPGAVIAAWAAELAEVTTDRNRYREWNNEARQLLAARDAELVGARAQVSSLEEELADAHAELTRVRDLLAPAAPAAIADDTPADLAEQAAAALVAARAETDRLQAQLAGYLRLLDLTPAEAEVEADQLAAARRDGAADALDDLAADYERHGALSAVASDSAVPLRGLPSVLRKRATEIRAGTREVPAPASGEEQTDAAE